MDETYRGLDFKFDLFALVDFQICHGGNREKFVLEEVLAGLFP